MFIDVLEILAKTGIVEVKALKTKRRAFALLNNLNSLKILNDLMIVAALPKIFIEDKAEIIILIIAIDTAISPKLFQPSRKNALP